MSKVRKWSTFAVLSYLAAIQFAVMGQPIFAYIFGFGAIAMTATAIRLHFFDREATTDMPKNGN